jgi:hypothetical protein
MYKKYVKHIQGKTPHHRRQHAMQVAGLFTALAFVVWVTTLGFRFAPVINSGAVANGTGGDQQTQLAGADAADNTSQNGVEVVGTTTSDFSNF